jgi:hypothetical protein
LSQTTKPDNPSRDHHLRPPRHHNKPDYEGNVYGAGEATPIKVLTLATPRHQDPTPNYEGNVYGAGEVAPIKDSTTLCSATKPGTNTCRHQGNGPRTHIRAAQQGHQGHEADQLATTKARGAASPHDINPAFTTTAGIRLLGN